MERFSQQGVMFVVSILLARTLMPEDFGLVAMLAIFLTIAHTLINSGFGQALIQKQGATYVDECSIFYFNIFVGFVSAGFLCAAAPLIAGFYNQTQLIQMIYALSLNLIISALGLVQITLLNKRLDFKTQLNVSVVSTVISGVVGVSMALNGFGVWSLVILSLCDTILRTSLLWMFNTWRPSWVFSFDSLRSMFGFGSRLLAVGLLNAFFQNVHAIVVGKFFSPLALGFYSRAESLQQLPVDTVSSIINKVTFPVFSSIQDDKPRLKNGVSKAMTMMVLIVFPMMVGLAIVAKPLVIVLLTEKWLPLVPYLQLFCVLGMLHPIHAINLNVLNAQGRSDLFLRLEIIKKILIVIVLIVTYRWGIIAMIYGQIAVSFLAYYLNAYYTEKILGYSIVEQIKDMFPSLVLAGLMGIVIYTINYASISDQLALLITQTVIAVVFYGGMCYFFRNPSFLELIQLFKSKLLNSSHV